MPSPTSARRLLRVEHASLALGVCALRGHVLVGEDAAHVPDDPETTLFVLEEPDGNRIHRCLRCLHLVERRPPAAPGVEVVPPPATWPIPLRGRALRDLAILRVIAIDKGIRAVLAAAVAVTVVVVARHAPGLHDSLLRILASLNGENPEATAVLRPPTGGLLGRIDWLLRQRSGTLDAVGGAIALYAALNAAEAIGLWRMRRWGEYLSAIATSAFIPLEVYEVIDRVTVLRLGALAINLAIVGWLVWSKRLFGLRGGAHAEHAGRMRDCTLAAVRRDVARMRGEVDATAPVSPAGGP